MSLKQKAISGLSWSLIDNFAGQGITFIIGIILARLILPQEFGLIGMIGVFIAISQTFVESGFIQALVRKQTVTSADFSTAFLFNMLVGIFFYILLFLFSGTIADFFNEPQLKSIVRVLGITVITNAASITQTTILLRNMDFKTQTIISLISNVLSGIIGIYLAYNGFGVWSLVWKLIAVSVIITLLQWIHNKWIPTFEFNKESFKQLFGFGSKLLIVSIIDRVYQNIYFIVIGKYFSAKELGYYTRADQFKALPSQNLFGVINKVSFPLLASIQDDQLRLKQNFRQILRSTMFITFVLMFGMAAVAEPLVLSLIGEPWRPTIILLQMLCLVGIFYPLQALNLNLLQIKGRSDLFLKIEILKKILAVPTIIVGIFFGIKIMILGILVNNIIAFYINSYWSGQLINYPFKEQIKDIIPSFSVALIVSIIIFIANYLFPYEKWILILILDMLAAGIMYLVICEFFRLKDYMYLKTELIQKIHSKQSQD